MGAPINAFEIVESIRFFGQLVSTEGVSEYTKRKANEYMDKLIDALEPSVNDTTAKSAGLIV
jgi:geranylgeranyl pyrophosphate synthase